MHKTASKTINNRPVESKQKSIQRDAHEIDFPVVGLGASAGGLEALQGFFSHFEFNCDMCFIVVMHQMPSHSSLLPELLTRFTDMPVTQAQNGMLLERNQIFVCPPGQNLAVFNRCLHLMDPVDFQATHLPIDYFFRSLAEDIKDKAIAVILSGTGTDGTLGMKVIKDRGGLTVAQDPITAKFGGMPSSAIASGAVDCVVPIEKMGIQLCEYVNEAPLMKRDQTSSEQLMSAEAIQKIFILLRSKTGHDLSSYKLTTIRRRIIRRMNIHRIDSVEEYVRLLQENPHEIDVLFKELLINVTHFFRDSEAYEVLAQKALPKLLEGKSDQQVLRIWVPGCSSGEEAYSIGILLKEVLEKQGKTNKFQIFATDLDLSTINMAREGTYPVGIESDVSSVRLKRFFKKENDHYRICKEIRDSVIFASQNLIKDPPFTHIDFISCRNLLIYLSADLQKELLPQLHYALNKQGILFLGSSESIGQYEDLFSAIDKKWKIYQRKDVKIRFPVSKLSIRSSSSRDMLTPEQQVLTGAQQTNQISRHIEKLLLQLYAPDCVVVNEYGKIIYVHGRTGPYLELSSGQPKINVVELAREGLRMPLATMLRKARKLNKTEINSKRVRVKTNADFEFVDLKLIKIVEPEVLRDLLLISFRPNESVKAQTTVTNLEIPCNENDEKRLLEEELYFAKESLSATIEELETANEELKSANEELQSYNEELETSKEEMQSLNEELNTVNSELQNKVMALSQINDDMQNLLNASEIATIFLDNQLKIKRFTRPATNLIKLIDSDIGRPLEDLGSTLKYSDLILDAKEVLKTLVFKDKEVQSTNGDWYLSRILPYRTADNIIDGLVITFVDISRIKQAEKMAHDADLTRSIVEAIRLPLLVLDSDFIILAGNPAFYRVFDVAPESVEFRSLFTIAGGAWNVPNIYEYLTKTYDRIMASENFCFQSEFPGVGFKRLILNGCILRHQATAKPHILLVIDDITENGDSCKL
ncbi:MAG: CheR family methyltransferase [Gammaproteobacteria bacterium]